VLSLQFSLELSRGARDDAHTIAEPRFAASLHSGGANVGFCDGSARFLSSSLDGRVYMALATVAGSEVLPDY
jgi:prepilin-type processing-associated H-X9-DG protein